MCELQHGSQWGEKLGGGIRTRIKPRTRIQLLGYQFAARDQRYFMRYYGLERRMTWIVKIKGHDHLERSAVFFGYLRLYSYCI